MQVKNLFARIICTAGLCLALLPGTAIGQHTSYAATEEYVNRKVGSATNLVWKAVETNADNISYTAQNLSTNYYTKADVDKKIEEFAPGGDYLKNPLKYYFVSCTTNVTEQEGVGQKSYSTNITAQINYVKGGWDGSLPKMFADLMSAITTNTYIISDPTVDLLTSCEFSAKYDYSYDILEGHPETAIWSLQVVGQLENAPWIVSNNPFDIPGVESLVFDFLAYSHYPQGSLLSSMQRKRATWETEETWNSPDGSTQLRGSFRKDVDGLRKNSGDWSIWTDIQGNGTYQDADGIHFVEYQSQEHNTSSTNVTELYVAATTGQVAAVAENLSTNYYTKAQTDDAIEPLLFAQYYPDGSVKSAAEFRDDIKYNLDAATRTATVKPFCNTGDSANDNSSLVGRVVIPPFVDAGGNGYISDDGTSYKVVGVSGDNPADLNTNLTAIIAPNTVMTIGSVRSAAVPRLRRSLFPPRRTSNTMCSTIAPRCPPSRYPPRRA